MKYAYLLVEGVTDVEIVTRFLKTIKKFKSLDNITDKDLPKLWHVLIPRTYPPPRSKGNLLTRIQIPRFLQNDDWHIAIQSANSISQIVQTFQEDLSVLGKVDQLHAIGFIIDADQDANTAYQNLQHELGKITPLTFLLHPGEVTTVANRYGIFVMPNNQQPGSAEKLLLEGAQHTYAPLLTAAQSYVQQVQKSIQPQNPHWHWKEFQKPFGAEKAVLSTIAAIFKPTKSLQTSISDNEWISNSTLQHSPSQQALNQFLNYLLT